MRAARQQDPQVVAAAYRHVEALVLSLDGLQPEKGHETLSVVRELNAKRIWCAEALLSSNADEVRRLVSQARAWATQVGLPVHLWLSDKHDALDRKSTRLNSSHGYISYAVFCLKKKKTNSLIS